MAVKPATLSSLLLPHIVVVRPSPKTSKLPLHHDWASCCALPTNRGYCESSDKSADDTGEIPLKSKGWQVIKDGLKNTTTQAYQQLSNIKGLTKTVTWYVPGQVSPPSIQGHRITMVQPFPKSQGPSSAAISGDTSSESFQRHSEMNTSGTKPTKLVRLKGRKRDCPITGQNGPVSSQNCAIETKSSETEVAFNSSKSEEPINEVEIAEALIVQSQETEDSSSTEEASSYPYRLFDVDSLLNAIQGKLQALEGLRNLGVSVEKEKGLPIDLKEAPSTEKSPVHFSEEFETGNQGDVYGDVIIQFKPKTKEDSDPSGIQQDDKVFGEHDPSVNKIFRDNLDEWYRERYQGVTNTAESGNAKLDSRGDISQKVSSSFFKDLGEKSNSVTSAIRSLELPAITESIQRFNKKFVRDQARSDEDHTTASPKEMKEDDAGFFFDTNSPLIDMTKAMGGISGLPMGNHRLTKSGKAKKRKVRSKQGGEKKIEEETLQERRSKVQLSQSSIRARARSLAVVVGKPSNMVSKLMNLQRLCTHLSEYPETREIAIQENLIPILLRLRNEVDEEAIQDEIRRALALMGYANPVKQKGIRILSVDGGGSRGVVPIEILRRLEDSCQQRIGDMFDFVIGVSSGAVLAFLLAIPKVELDECERLYKDMSVKVFGQNKIAGTRNLVMNHSYYDTDGWVDLLRNHLHGKGAMPISETARDPTCPKVAAVATVMNVGTLRDHLFRNYNLPPGTRSFYEGSSKYRLWEALRASSAAPGYFEEFKLGGHVFQDGGVLTNNPCALGVHECRRLWPDTPIQCVVSVGTGRYEPPDQEFPAEYSSLKTKLFKVLCSATDTEAVHTTLKDLLPAGTYFRFNPILSEDFLLDENDPNKLAKMQEDARQYLARNELKMMQATGVLTREKSLLDKINDWITLKKDMRIPRRKAQKT